MSDLVATRMEGDIAVVTIDNPPVNALSHALRTAIHTALERAKGDSAARAIVLTGAGPTFVAGAEIKEFGSDKAKADPSLPDLIALLESIDKPTVAAIHGTALGGGLELSFGCHYRVALAGSKVGLPEINLGLIPGAGGTQRMPRLVGPERALDIIVSGKPIAVETALKDGIVDAVFESELVENAVAFARAKADSGETTVHIRDRDDKIVEWKDDPDRFDTVIAEKTKKSRGLDAPVAAGKAVKAALTMGIDDGLKFERNQFLRLVTGEQSEAQRHIFFAQREATKVPGVGKDVKPRTVKTIGVIGAGTMGGGIAMSMANGGYDVTILEMNREALDKGLDRISKTYDISVKRGSMTQDAKAKRMARLSGTTSYDDLSDCDLIIEAVFEDIGVKEDVFGKLDGIAKDGAILASNTSYLDVDRIAGFTKRPDDVLGTHFFSPANVMKLLEIVRGEKTAPDVVATALEVGKRAGKVPVVVGVCHGFVGNRMLEARSAEAEDLLLEGATPAQVDKAFRDFGWPMGPYQMSDLAGIDIGWRKRQARGERAEIADTLAEQGDFGQKTGKGYYSYEDGRTPVPRGETQDIIERVAKEKGVERRDISDEEILERTLYPMINEGAKILEEGIATRPSDIDVVWVYGYGFPVGKGGPMHWADRHGLAKIVERLEHWGRETGKDVYTVSPLLKTLAGEGGSFAEYQKQGA
ncbi:3-hydroxyacyl-CoA dehydrogenase NAD-binding domain-containing protein [Notoacmeibacter sp. MSK16QG-6]|uniref:3-hydroxyacyl-CoA dehydrogenase NAD-binding domain-containing protein n=1 Tax=Notoacmeibacter sp. MSK16QG-6 TaxID=2957982 RepID=UPI00209EBA98|nr:3-hydroxyacyl-CoA dehydrogenase NAD-binding domain-containing protein [Notoacmeibacter sp. MSK16QG-6]MCP1198484.1 3-hydroxyacyl-CoA dehydrogenase NAD-binding domain-containing protein [Notoacmeibacter sp. MSK16QG-6]